MSRPHRRWPMSLVRGSSASMFSSFSGEDLELGSHDRGEKEGKGIPTAWLRGSDFIIPQTRLFFSPKRVLKS